MMSDQSSLDVDAMRDYAKTHGMTLERGHHGGDLWDLLWKRDDTLRKIQIWLENTRNYVEVWLVALAWHEGSDEREPGTTLHPRHYVLRLPTDSDRLIETLDMARMDAESMVVTRDSS